MSDTAGKPRISRRPDAVRERVLDAAQAEFMAEGFAGASTNRMLERFGGSKPTMFRHFPTKRALFQAVVARIAGRWVQAVDPGGDASDPEAWLTAFATQALRWILGEDNLFVGRMAVAEGMSFPEVAETYRSLAVEPIEQALAARLADWTGAGVLRCRDPRADAIAFLDLTLSGVVSRALYRVHGEVSQDEIARHVAERVELFLNGRRVR